MRSARPRKRDFFAATGPAPEPCHSERRWGCNRWFGTANGKITGISLSLLAKWRCNPWFGAANGAPAFARTPARVSGCSARPRVVTARCAAPGPLVPAAFGRSTRGSESVAAPLAAPNARPLHSERRWRGNPWFGAANGAPAFARTPARVSGHSARPRVVTARCAAPGPLVPAAYGRFTRGSECEAAPFGSPMALQPMVRSRERGAGVRQNAGQSERLQRKAARRHRALGFAGAARSCGLRPLHSRLRIRRRYTRSEKEPLCLKTESSAATRARPRTSAYGFPAPSSR